MIQTHETIHILPVSLSNQESAGFKNKILLMLVEIRVKKRGEASQDPGNLMVNTARPLYKLEVSCFFFLSPAKGNVVSTPHPLGILSLVARLCQAWHPSHWNERWLKKKVLFVCHTLSKECQR